MRPLPPHTSPDTKGTRNGIFRFATNAAADGHPLAELRPYIDWTYFFHAWGFEPRYASIARADSPESWLAAIPPRQQAKAAEALRLYHDAGLLLDQLAACPTARVESIYRLCTAYSDGDDLLLDGVRLPLLRQQTSRGTTEAPSLCLSDFVRPLSQGIPDVVGVFATAAHMPETDTGTADDPYRHLLVQTLADRLAEAATELAHLWIRRHAWGYAPDERLDIPALLAGKFQGIRPAVGYPSLPDQSVNFILDRPAAIRAHRHQPYPKRSHVAPLLYQRTHASPPRRPLFRRRPHRYRPAGGLRTPTGAVGRCPAAFPAQRTVKTRAGGKAPGTCQQNILKLQRTTTNRLACTGKISIFAFSSNRQGQGGGQQSSTGQCQPPETTRNKNIHTDKEATQEK